MTVHARFFVLAIAAITLLVPGNGVGAQNLPFLLFERYLEPLRVSAGIPGLSAAIVYQGKVVWERGFGLRDIEGNLEASPATPYAIGELTQPIAGALLLHCVERGLVRLDQPVAELVPGTTAAGTVRQLLSHSQPSALNGFRYDPARYALLTRPIESCFGDPYRLVVAREVFERLTMKTAVPGVDIDRVPAELRDLFDGTTLERYRRTLAQVATPYRVDRRARATRNDAAATGVDAATGLVASVRDLAEFDMAPTVHLRPETLASAWTNSTHNGVPTPFGLGWFVQTYNGEKVVWHFGHVSEAYSSLMLKVPSRGLTLILLANSDGLSAPFPLHDGDVTSSLFARTFLRLFL
jgi:CubicO group peptidase (beta-lactamase class C family)